MAQGVEEVLVAADAAELDLTNAHLRNLDDVPLPESLSVRQMRTCPIRPRALLASDGNRKQFRMLRSCLISLLIGSQSLTAGS